MLDATNWIRLDEGEQSWHLLLGITPNGLVVANCGANYPATDDIEQFPASHLPPTGHLCVACGVAWRSAAE